MVQCYGNVYVLIGYYIGTNATLSIFYFNGGNKYKLRVNRGISLTYDDYWFHQLMTKQGITVSFINVYRTGDLYNRCDVLPYNRCDGHILYRKSCKSQRIFKNIFYHWLRMDYIHRKMWFQVLTNILCNNKKFDLYINIKHSYTWVGDTTLI
jgi:hypothetical protein